MGEKTVNYSDRMDYNLHENHNSHQFNQQRWLIQISHFFEILLPEENIHQFKKRYYGKDLRTGDCRGISPDELQEDIVSCGDIMLAQMLDLVRYGNLKTFKADQTTKFRVEMASYLLKEAVLIDAVN